MKGITLARCPGIGDKIQFTSVPENYFHQFGERLVDVDHSWVFDYNPYVVRQAKGEPLDQVFDPWDISPSPALPDGRTTYHSLAERCALMFGVKKVVLKHPRLYRFEDEHPQHDCVVHALGMSQPSMSKDIVDHIGRAYPESVQVGRHDDPLWFPIDGRCAVGDSMWSSVLTIARARTFIGVDSGPSWIAACYPRVHKKKILMQYNSNELEDLVPMKVFSPETHWFDPAFTYFNRLRQDCGPTYSYLKV